MKILLSFILLISSFLFGDEYMRGRSYSRTNQRMIPGSGKLNRADNMLFILHAQDGHLQKNPDKRSLYLLTLYNVGRDVTYLTDGPSRKAGKLTVEEFIKSFRHEKPNAGLVGSQDSLTGSYAKFSDITMTLSNPKYDKVNNRLIVDVEILGRRQSLPSGDLGATTLFIDDFSPYPGG